MRCIAALAVLVASAAFADDTGPAKELDTVTVHPRHDDPLFEADRKLKDLVDHMPCMGCDAVKRKPEGWKETVKDIGKAALDQITPINPETRTSDPGNEPADLSPDAVSRTKPSADGGRMDPSLDGGIKPLGRPGAIP